MTIQETLRLLGITRCYKGSKHIEFAVTLVVSEEDRLEAVTKEIYMETASHFHCKWGAVERNIRTAVARAWEVNPKLLRKMAGYPLARTPTASEFIEIIASYMMRSDPPPSDQRPIVTP